LRLYSFLKLFRVITAVIFITILSFCFVNIYSLIPPDTARYLALTQFVPSVLSFILVPSMIFSSFIFIILLTVLAGRSYCSFLCPLGIFQDIVSRLSSIFKIKKNYRYTLPHNLIRYSILALVILSYSTAGTFIIRWLDPYSLYGRFAHNILYPAATGINNITADMLLKFNIFLLHPVDIKYGSSGIMLLTFILILSISAMAVLNGRLYCNTLCPVGSLLGIVSKISLIKIKIDKKSCVHCGKCEKICKSSSIRHGDDVVDFSRCVSCFNCLPVCPNSSIKFRFTFPRNKRDEQERVNPLHYSGKSNITRKSFIAGIILTPAILSAQPTVKKKVLYIQDRSKQKEYLKKTFASPPGSLGTERFNERCSACSLCITGCPSSVLQPSVMQYGIHGIMQPYLDFNTGYCNYDCVICSELCPTGAINKISVAEKHLIQTGKSTFIKENCITYTNGTDCGACSEHCPTKAVNMAPFKNNLVIPEINQKICTGCGACEHVCPVRPFKAIYVEGNRTHDRAELPRKEKKITAEKGDFPF